MQHPHTLSWRDIKCQTRPRCGATNRRGVPCGRAPARPGGYCLFHGGTNPRDQPLVRHLLHTWATAGHPLPTAITLCVDRDGAHQAVDIPPGAQVMHVTHLADLAQADADPVSTYAVAELRNPVHYDAVCTLDRRARVRWLPEFVDVLLDTRRVLRRRRYHGALLNDQRYRY